MTEILSNENAGIQWVPSGPINDTEIMKMLAN